jgi:hypothetical protein
MGPKGARAQPALSHLARLSKPSQRKQKREEDAKKALAEGVPGLGDGAGTRALGRL